VLGGTRGRHSGAIKRYKVYRTVCWPASAPSLRNTGASDLMGAASSTHGKSYAFTLSRWTRPRNLSAPSTALELRRITDDRAMAKKIAPAPP